MQNIPVSFAYAKACLNLIVEKMCLAGRDHAKSSDDNDQTSQAVQQAPSDPLSIAARELISKDHLVSQSSAMFDAVLDELSDEQSDHAGRLVMDTQHLHLSAASRNLLRGAICEPAHTGRLHAECPDTCIEIEMLYIFDFWVPCSACKALIVHPMLMSMAKR